MNLYWITTASQALCEALGVPGQTRKNLTSAFPAGSYLPSSNTFFEHDRDLALISESIESQLQISGNACLGFWPNHTQGWRQVLYAGRRTEL